MTATRVKQLSWSAIVVLTIGLLLPTGTADAQTFQAKKISSAQSATDDDLRKDLQSAIDSVVAKYRKQLAEQRASSEKRIAELESETAKLRAQVEELRRALGQRRTPAGDRPATAADSTGSRRPATAAEDRPFLGVALGPPEGDLLSKLGLERGVQVMQVVPETPAARVGLKPYDVITKLAGKRVDSESFTEVIQGQKAGDRVAIEYSRLVDSQPVRFEARVKLGRRSDYNPSGTEARPERPAAPERPEAAPAERAKVTLGARVRQEGEFDLTIVDVTGGSNAAEAGLRDGDKLVSIAGKKLATIDTVKEVLGSIRAGDTKTIGFRRGDTNMKAKLRWGGGDVKPSLDSITDDAPAKPRKPGFLGISVDVASGSLRIDEVIEGSSAAKMGLEVGDVILAVNGTKAESLEQVGGIFSGLFAGDSLTIKVKRGDDTRTVKGKLGARDDGNTEQAAVEAEGEKPYVGMEVRELGESDLEIADVFAGSAAAEAGLAVGDKLVSFAQQPLRRLEDIRDALDVRRPGDVVETEVLRKGSRLRFELTLGVSAE